MSEVGDFWAYDAPLGLGGSAKLSVTDDYQNEKKCLYHVLPSHFGCAATSIVAIYLGVVSADLFLWFPIHHMPAALTG